MHILFRLVRIIFPGQSYLIHCWCHHQNSHLITATASSKQTAGGSNRLGQWEETTCWAVYSSECTLSAWTDGTTHSFCFLWSFIIQSCLWGQCLRASQERGPSVLGAAQTASSSRLSLHRAVGNRAGEGLLHTSRGNNRRAVKLQVSPMLFYFTGWVIRTGISFNSTFHKGPPELTPGQDQSPMAPIRQALKSMGCVSCLKIINACKCICALAQRLSTLPHLMCELTYWSETCYQTESLTGFILQHSWQE